MTGNRTALHDRLRGLVLLTFLLATVTTAAAAQTTTSKIDILQVDGALDGTIARYLDDALLAAADEGVEVVVLQLSTAGTLDVPAARFVETIRDSRVPVVIWVGPPGARVTGAGVELALSADLLAMAPGSVLGGAVPGDLGDDATLEERRERAATLQALAELRGRDAAVVAGLASDDGAVVAAPDGDETLGADAALPAGVDRAAVSLLDAQELAEAGLADVVAPGLPELLAQLDGVEFVRDDGSVAQITIDPQAASVRFNNQGLVGRLLHTVSTPTLAYLLLIGGLVCLLFEWFQPGFGVAGSCGVVLAGLGLYGISVLPAQWWALALVVIGLALLAVDLALASLGPVTAAGAISLAAGSWWLYDGPDTLRLAGWLVALVVASALIFFVFVMTTVLRAQGVQTQASMAAVLGEVGTVRSVLNPQGHVFVGGALWRAQAVDGPVSTGTPVRVTGIADEMTLLVEPAAPMATADRGAGDNVSTD